MGADGGAESEWSGFRPGERLIELAEAVRADPALSRDAMAHLLARHGESAAELEGFTEADADELRAAVVHLTSHVLRETDVDRAALALNALLEQCGARPRLSRHDGHAWHLHVDRGDEAGWADWFTASSALTLARLLGERGAPAWGECAAHGCARLFLTHGPGAARRYCTPTCASRARVAAHRRRRRESGGGSGSGSSESGSGT
ncbi:CGNR zinc finger domain-containing protein [Streptomyces iconiensis]|uniref:CGNR zinc finger domain-containing protein n=1 Tax=Streptomyces iconiensis TaxID=1384038 RepID=A0ABT6ZNT1_9ACTN|nr:CGNR zinc finger domain-containing protein [Streptomyces iconiensis]MDJ1130695.1 CGNR zinc finger domain-containing protein [Streptomyces iconiensis]